MPASGGLKIFLPSIFVGCLVLGLAGQSYADCAGRLLEIRGVKGLLKRHMVLEKAVLECSDTGRIHYFYAYNLERLRRYDAALLSYENAVRVDPDFAPSYFGMGDVYLVLGNNKAAVFAYKKGLTLEPGNKRAENSLKKARSSCDEQKLAADGDKQEVQPPQKVQPQDLQPKKNIAVPVVDVPVAIEPVASAEDFIRYMTQHRAESGNTPQPVLPMYIQFERGSDTLTESDRNMLDNIVCRALQSDELLQSRFEVGGHTDASGNFDFNMHLSRVRAHGVRDYLVDCGVEPQRLTVVYFGQTRPVVANSSPQNRRLNRRVEFRRLQEMDE